MKFGKLLAKSCCLSNVDDELSMRNRMSMSVLIGMSFWTSPTCVVSTGLMSRAGQPARVAARGQAQRRPRTVRMTSSPGKRRARQTLCPLGDQDPDVRCRVKDIFAGILTYGPKP